MDREDFERPGRVLIDRGPIIRIPINTRRKTTPTLIPCSILLQDPKSTVTEKIHGMDMAEVVVSRGLDRPGETSTEEIRGSIPRQG
jgi:hypothetical protein